MDTNIMAEPMQPMTDAILRLAHRYDEATDSFHFLDLDHQLHEKAAFLTDEYIPADWARQVEPRGQHSAMERPGTPLHFIFHSGFCCSTLMTRALHQPGIATSLSEPTILRDIVGYHGRSSDEDRYRNVLDTSLSLLARPFQPGEAVVAKPSCIVNGHAGDMLAMREDSRAIFLYAPVRVFLNSIARKAITGRLWARELFIGLQKANHMDLGFSDEQLFGQTDLQIAGLAWLIQNMRFAALIDQHGESRIRTIDSEAFLADPAKTLQAVGMHFDLAISSEQALAISKSATFSTHSKFGEEFDADSRREDRASGENVHADEIEKVAIWVETVAKAINAPMTMAGPLLS